MTCQASPGLCGITEWCGRDFKDHHVPTPCHGHGQLHQNLLQALLGHFCIQVCACLGSELLSKGAFSLSLPDAAAVTGFLNYLKFM